MAVGMQPQDVYELVNAGDPRISPDGLRVAYTVTRLDKEANEYCSAIWVAQLEGSAEPRPFTSGEKRDTMPRWSPDGEWLAFASTRGEDKTPANIYVLPAEGGEARKLTDQKESVESIAWSPDSSRLAFTVRVRDEAYEEEDERKRAPRRFKRIYHKLDSVGWTGDRRKHVFVVDRESVHLYGVAADGSAAPELLVGGEQAISLYDVRDGTLAYVASRYTTMRELYAGTDGKLVGRVGREFEDGRELVEPERITAVSRDGYEVDAWVVRPAGFEPGKRYPALLSIHGGPFSQYGTGFFDEFQVYAGAGHVVLYANPRGGSGYSEEHGRAIRGPLNDAGPGWGTVDFDDLMAVVDTALETFDFVDPERLGVIGGSYGGYMTSWIIGHTNRFKAAVSERAVNNLVSMFGSSDVFWIFERQFGGPLWEDVGAYLEKSPSTYALDMATPVLVLHSEQDLRCNIEQGEHLFTLLRLLRKDVEMVRFPAESHELSRSGSPIHRVQRFETILEWFGRYLAPGT